MSAVRLWNGCWRLLAIGHKVAFDSLPWGIPTNDVLHLGSPATVSRLQRASNDAERDAAWAEFTAAHSDVVLRTCRSVAHDHDAAMDAYVFVLDALRRDDHRRLRAYMPDGRTSFSTWLVVVTRRLVLDHLRRKYGRSRSTDDARRADSGTRRALEDMLGDAMDPDQIAASSPPSDLAVRRAELIAALRAALDTLEPSDRLLLALRFADERSIRQIARVIGAPTIFHVYRRLGALLSRLRTELARRGIEDPEP